MDLDSENYDANSSLVRFILAIFDGGMRTDGGVMDMLGTKWRGGDTVGEGEDAKVSFFMNMLAIRYIMDTLFFVIILLIMLNVLLGIIVDSFGQLRDEKN